MAKEKSAKVSSNIEGYTRFVLDGLVGIYGTSRSDVVSFILKSWIRNNRDELKDYSLDVMHWKK